MEQVQQWVKDTRYFSDTVVDKDNIPMYFVLILLLVCIILISKARKFLIPVGVVWALLMLGLFVSPSKITEYIPVINSQIIMTRELGNDSYYTMYLASDADNTIFTFSEHTETDLESWLNEIQGNTVYLSVDKDGTQVYNKDLGYATPDNSETLYGIYQYWVDNGIVPEEKTRYKLWKFYLDV